MPIVHQRENSTLRGVSAIGRNLERCHDGLDILNKSPVTFVHVWALQGCRRLGQRLSIDLVGVGGSLHAALILLNSRNVPSLVVATATVLAKSM